MYWRRDDDKLIFATRLLEEGTDDFNHDISSYTNICALGIRLKSSLTSQAQITKEISTDATLRDNVGMELIAVLAELDETGVPPYWFISKVVSNNSTVVGA